MPFSADCQSWKGGGHIALPRKNLRITGGNAAVAGNPFLRQDAALQDADEWKQVLPLLNRSCVVQVTLHPRIGKQQYKGEVNRAAFQAFYEACELPLVYNGDLRTLEAVQKLMDAYPRLKGVMLGRGLLADPSLARSIREGKAPDKATLYRQVAEMHRLMYEHYSRTIEGGEAQLLAKLKTMWEYLLPDMEKKPRKAILKSNRLDAYLRAVAEALR